MKKVKIKNILTNREAGSKMLQAKMDLWLNKNINNNTWGQKRRTLQRENVPTNLELLIVNEWDEPVGVPPEEGETDNRETIRMAELRSEYDFYNFETDTWQEEITYKDITDEVEAEEQARQDRALEIDDLKSQAIGYINASDKPVWEKKLLKRLVRELRK